MTEAEYNQLYSEYMYCVSQVEALKAQIMNYGYAYDEQHGWYNQYNRPLSKAQQDDVNDKIDKLKKYVAYVAEINKKSGK